MKILLILIVASAGTVFAGSNEVALERVVVSHRIVRLIPALVVQGIKNRAVYDFPGHPKQQGEAITAGIEAWFELQKIPNNPAKCLAAIQFPNLYPKQLYLAQRPF